VRAPKPDVVAAGPHVARKNHHIAWQLALQIDRELLHARRLSVLIDVADIAVEISQGATAVSGWSLDAGRERIVERRRRAAARAEDGILRVPDLAVVTFRRERNRIIERRPVQAIAAAEDCLRIDGVDGTDAWRPL